MAELLTLPRMARRLQVTQTWLKEQAQAGTVPSLAAGRNRYLFNADAVAAALAQKAAGEIGTHDDSEVQHEA